MTGNILTLKSQQPLPAGKGLLVTQDKQTIRVLMWNQHFVEEKNHTSWSGSIELPATKDTTLHAIRSTIGVGNGRLWERWPLMQRPVNPTPAQFEKGYTKMVFNLKPGEVQYFEISVPSPSATTRFVNAEDFKIWDKAMGEKSN